jgi:transcriptional regulator with XRE-family HTH domain
MLAKQITSLRARSGMTQQQLAKELHVGPSAIGMYEQGRRVPSIEMLVQMADLFCVSLDYLITGKEFSGMATSENGVTTQPDCRCRSCCACCNPKG